VLHGGKKFDNLELKNGLIKFDNGQDGTSKSRKWRVETERERRECVREWKREREYVCVSEREREGRTERDRERRRER